MNAPIASFPPEDYAHIAELLRAKLQSDGEFKAVLSNNFNVILAALDIAASDQYDRGRRDMLNALLALNPKAAQRLHMCNGGTEHTFENHAGRLPFDVVFWVTEVAEQLGIQPKDDDQTGEVA